MAKITVQFVGDNSQAMKSLTEIQRKINDIERNPIEIKIDAVGDTEVLKMQTKLEQARASTARANAKIAESEAKVKIARQQTKTVTAQTVLEEKKAETAKKQATLETKKATRAENERQVAIERGNTALKKKEEHEARANATTKQTELVQERAKASAEKRAASEGKVTSAIKKQETATKSLTNTIQQYIKWYLRWTLVSGAFQRAIGAVREALETMKAVDSELVTVRKVTGFSADEMKAVEEQAYKTASAYGVAANEYLESVAAFARAGYKEQSAALAELSTKTQIVGDTTAEVANQFLLSTDAAYKYGGSIEELSKVLDGANELDNKYATSISKIAEGMGIVAPVAAQMNVSIDELAAAIGTITAVTQRSGSEAARALRALFLNIAGDTKTEIDEGVTWTTGEIEGLREVVKLYAKDAYDAAQATGSVIDPMRAMEGLAKSMQDGLLTEQKLIEMVSDIGGKLRSSQLLAIIQNWDMYQNMLQDYGNAIGSADREVENALDSWERKTNILKNTWTEFISHLIETKEIKGAIDLLTQAIEFLDSGLGRAAVTAWLLFTALKMTNAISGLTALISGLITTIGGLTTVTELFNVVWSQSPFVVVAIGVAAIYGIVKAVDALTVTYDEQKETLESLQKEYNKLYGNGSEIETLRRNADNLTAAEKNRLAVLEAQEASLKRQIIEQTKLTFASWREGRTRGGYGDMNAEEVSVVSHSLAALNSQYNAGKISATEYKNAVQNLVVYLQSSAETILAAKDAGIQLTASEYTLVNLYQTLVRQLAEKTSAEKEDTAAKNDNADATDKVAEANSALKTAFEEVDSKGSLTYGTLAQLEALYPGLSARILDANGNLTAEGAAALGTRAALYDLIASMISANTTALNFDGQIAELQRLATEAGVASGMIRSVFSTGFAAGTGNWDEVSDMSPDEYASWRMGQAVKWTSDQVKQALKESQTLTTPPGGGGGQQPKTADELLAEEQQAELNRLKQIVSDEKAKYELMVAQGKSQTELAAQAKVIQGALSGQADFMRQIGSSYSDVASLSKEWWDWEKKRKDDADYEGVVEHLKSELSFMEASNVAADERIRKMREIQNALHEQAEYLRSIGTSEDEVRKLSIEWWNIQNNILDIQKQITEEEQKRAEEALKAQLDAHKDAISFLKQELTYLKASGASEDEQIAKMRRIQDAIRAQLDYMKSIGASQEDIVAAATDWWNVENDILAIQDKLAQQLQDEIANTVKQITDALQTAAGAMTDPMQAELDAMQKQRDAADELREEEEKRLDVQEKMLALEKARIALLNAQRERNVRQYNARTGQWEWVADARAVESAQKNVESAQKNLIDAQTNLAKYMADKEYEAQRATIQRSIDYTKKAFDSLRSAIEETANAIRDGKMSYSEAYAYIKKKLKEIYDEYGIDLTGVLGDILANLDGVDEDFASLLRSLATVEDGYEKLAKILDSVPKEYQQSVIKSLADIFSTDLTDKAKAQILKDIDSIFSNTKLTAEAKTSILTGIKTIFENDQLKAETKTKIVSAISALVGGEKDAVSAVALFTEFMRTAFERAQNPEDAINTLCDRINSGAIKFDNIDKLLANVHDETNRLLLIAQMKLNSAKWWLLPKGSDEQKALEQQNQTIGNALGWSYDAETGYWRDENGNIAYEPDRGGTEAAAGGSDLIPSIDSNVSTAVDLLDKIRIGIGDLASAISNLGSKSTSNSSSSSSSSSSTSNKPSGSKTIATNGSTTISQGSNGNIVISGLPPILTSIANKQNSSTQTYDSGGILHGLGGIKATAEDEMVLPPDATSALLKAEESGAFNALLNHLGIVTAAANSYAGFSGGLSRNSIGSQHNGDVFYINGELAEYITSGTTIGQLAQLARTLNLRKGS